MEKEPDYRESGWRVYAIAPEADEFWQGDTGRLYNRLQYVPGTDAGDWQKQYLWP
jgi:pyridoxine/pyridoxamine 5'-phosphate oxidase